MPFLDVSAGQVIASSHMDLAIGQSVMRFTSAAQRDAQLPAPTVGMFCYLQDLNYFQVFDPPVTGGANQWRVIGSLRMGYAQMGDAQTIATGTATRLKIGTLIGGAANRPGRATWTTNVDYVTVPLAGTYLAIGDVTWPDNGTGQRRLYVYKAAAGTTTFGLAGVAGGVTEINSAGTTTLRQGVSALVTAAANERIALVGWHSAGVTLTLPGGQSSDTASFSLHFMGSD